jgi:hypothetical protein
VTKPSQHKRSISAVLIPWALPNDIASIERYRVSWERTHGPTDLTKYYTSRWPERDIAVLYDSDFKAFFDGLPPFFQSWIRDKMDRSAAAGALDNMPDEYIRLYFANRMRGTGEDSCRGR